MRVRAVLAFNAMVYIYLVCRMVVLYVVRHGLRTAVLAYRLPFNVIHECADRTLESSARGSF